MSAPRESEAQTGTRTGGVLYFLRNWTSRGSVRYQVKSEEQLCEFLAACRESRPPILVQGVLLEGVLRPLPSEVSSTDDSG